MSELLVLRLFGNPLEFLPEILPCINLRHLSLANVRIEADQSLSNISVEVEVSGLFCAQFGHELECGPPRRFSNSEKETVVSYLIRNYGFGI